ncbi:MAG TPA: hypothetical protein VMV94_07495 [Phycisphaerae bacterium]|nr:hypothetical protein [Phycisphaerae bacterium]
MCSWRSICTYTVFALGVALAAGCHHGHEKVRETREVVIERPEPLPAPPPGTVVLDEPPPPPREVVIVHEAPPPLIVEPVPPLPAVGMVWVGGYWVHDHGHYAWCRGRYVRPVPGHRLEPAHWEHTHRGYEFHGERWEPHESRGHVR